MIQVFIIKLRSSQILKLLTRIMQHMSTECEPLCLWRRGHASSIYTISLKSSLERTTDNVLSNYWYSARPCWRFCLESSKVWHLKSRVLTQILKHDPQYFCHSQLELAKHWCEKPKTNSFQTILCNSAEAMLNSRNKWQSSRGGKDPLFPLAQ